MKVKWDKTGTTQNRKGLSNLVIGITGGVGAGKSYVMEYLHSHYGVYVILADNVAKELQMPGKCVYHKMVALLGKECLEQNGELNRSCVAKKIFQDESLRLQINEIVHPEVKKEIVARIAEAQKKYPYIAVEAALLIEEHYDTICDELWYVDVADHIRMERLASARGYSKEKSMDIMKKQMSRERFRMHCQRCIDNSGTQNDLKRQLDDIFKTQLHCEELGNKQ